MISEELTKFWKWSRTYSAYQDYCTFTGQSTTHNNSRCYKISSKTTTFTFTF